MKFFMIGLAMGFLILWGILHLRDKQELWEVTLINMKFALCYAVLATVLVIAAGYSGG